MSHLIITKPRVMRIIAMGEEEFAEAMRLAGITEVYTVRSREEVERLVKKFSEEELGGLIILSSKIAPLVKDLIEKLTPRLAPLVIEIPGPNDVAKFNIREFYINMARRFIGFTIGIPGA